MPVAVSPEVCRSGPVDLAGLDVVGDKVDAALRTVAGRGGRGAVVTKAVDDQPGLVTALEPSLRGVRRGCAGFRKDDCEQHGLRRFRQFLAFGYARRGHDVR